jgi:hypothetical protein
MSIFSCSALTSKISSAIEECSEYVADTMTVENLQKVSSVAFTGIATVGSIYFSLEYSTTKSIYDLVFSTTLLSCGAQGICDFNIDYQNLQSSIWTVTSIAFGVFSFVSSTFFLFQTFSAYQGIKMLGFGAHFVMGLKPFIQLNPLIQEKQNSLHKPYQGVKAKKRTAKEDSGIEKPLTSSLGLRRQPSFRTAKTDSSQSASWFGAGMFFSMMMTSHPQAFVNHGNTCFVNATLKGLLKNPAFIRQLKEELVQLAGETAERFAERKHLQTQLRNIVHQLNQPKPNKEVISQALLEIRRKNPLVLRQFSDKRYSHKSVGSTEIKLGEANVRYRVIVNFPEGFTLTKREEEDDDAFAIRQQVYARFSGSRIQDLVNLEKVVPLGEMKKEKICELLSLSEDQVQIDKETSHSLQNLSSQQDAIEFHDLVVDALQLHHNPKFSLKKVLIKELPNGTRLDPDICSNNIIKLGNSFPCDRVEKRFVRIHEEDTDLVKLEDESDEDFKKRENLFQMLKKPIEIKQLSHFHFGSGDLVETISSYLKIDRKLVELSSKVEQHEKREVQIADLLKLNYTDKSTLENINGEAVQITEHHSIRSTNSAELESVSFSLPWINQENLEKRSGLIFPDILQEQKIQVFDETLNEEKEISLKVHSIVCHLGASTKSGHYISYVLEGDQWFCHNDKTITEVTAESVEMNASKAAYLVNYLIKK